jgi:hypothetical protein
MIRGTFANIRIRNKITPDIEGGVTKHFPSNDTMSIYDAAMRYQSEGRPLVVFAGKEYGTGSSRDWAAKGTNLLGVRAVIAQSFERIHRSNLVGMGIAPFVFEEGTSWQTLGLTGNEKITMLRPPSLDGTVARNGLFGKATMFWSVAARSAKQEQAATLVDYLLNDPGANKIQLVNRGVPSNPAAITAMGDGLTATDQEVVGFMKKVLTEITGTPAVQPMGTSDSQNSFTRYLTEVRFERMTPAAAAEATIKEVDAMVQTG